MNYHIDWLKEQKGVEYLFFWGHQPSKKGSIVKTCLSQWWEAPFTEEKTVYKTAEHYMMAQKAKLFNDIETLKKFLKKNLLKV